MDGPFRRSAQRDPRLAMGLIAIGLALAGLGGCAAATTSPSDGSAEPSLPVLTPTRSAETTELPPASPETTPSASTLLPTGPLSGLGPVIPGRWTGMRWIAGPPSQELTEESTDPNTAISIDFGVFSWSHGYVGFRYREEQPLASGGRSSLSIVTETSPDGLNWTRDGVLELPNGYTYQDLADYPMTITDVVEGPAGLLAIGRILIPIQTVGHPAAAIWTSSDGRSWRLLGVSNAFGGQPWIVGAGSAGYIATGSPGRGEPASVWTSADGRTWLRRDISAFGMSNVQTRDAAAFAGGYVLAAEMVAEDTSSNTITLTPSLWWSADGRSWSRDALAGSTPSTLPLNVLPYPDWEAGLSLHRIGDHSLVAVQTSEEGLEGPLAREVWVSTDGRAWKVMPGVDLENALVLSNGQRAVVVPHTVDSSSGPVVEAFEEDLSLVTLAQTGDLPTGWFCAGALGPTGLVVADETQHRFLVGVPTNY